MSTDGANYYNATYLLIFMLHSRFYGDVTYVTYTPVRPVVLNMLFMWIIWQFLVKIEHIVVEIFL